MKIRLNKAHFPVNGLGPGQRIGLWFQGCSIRCKGCASLDTWGQRPETAIDVNEVVAWCASHLVAGANGVTVSGGEPFDQPGGLRYLLEQLRSFGHRRAVEFDVLCFTGFKYAFVEEHFSEVLPLLDAIVSEPFEEGAPTDKYLCGSENQILRPLSDRGRARYQRVRSDPQLRRHMDVCVSQDAVFLSGIPSEGDLAKLRDALKARGVNLGKVSWRA